MRTTYSIDATHIRITCTVGVTKEYIMLDKSYATQDALTYMITALQSRTYRKATEAPPRVRPT